jgi:hypothetical protein
MMTLVSVSKSQINGKNIFWKKTKGSEIQDAMVRGLFMANNFGICSPKTMCMRVIPKSAILNARV